MAAISMFDWPLRVYYEDTDAGGVVYHSQYLNFMERARTEWLRHIGFEQTHLRDELHTVIVVHSLQVQFKKPARFNDELTVKSQIVEIGRSSMQFAQSIMRGADTLIEAQVRVACVNVHSFKPVAIPSPVLNVISSLKTESA